MIINLLLETKLNNYMYQVLLIHSNESIQDYGMTRCNRKVWPIEHASYSIRGLHQKGLGFLMFEILCNINDT